ncbi:hypothetical protein, conserved [Eimeria praecox]|uniref:Uncharacterized protein n=1 Tax=Eimeria praecox TaxID=51316 RepID=U6H504_9EIME|nr:hypothetical protein, conserved [Eimeria praecox]
MGDPLPDGLLRKDLIHTGRSVGLRKVETQSSEVGDGRDGGSQRWGMTALQRVMLHNNASLLPALRDDQGLRLALKVSRILALELGALSLAPQSFEHLRLRAGRALIYLTTVSLNYGGQDSRHEAACQELRSLTGLITGICEPSVVHFQTSPRVLHAKLSALVGASIVVVGFSVNVLLGLSQHASGSSQGLPPILVEQQLGVLEALFETHGSIIGSRRSSSCRLLNAGKSLCKTPQSHEGRKACSEKLWMQSFGLQLDMELLLRLRCGNLLAARSIIRKPAQVAT